MLVTARQHGRRAYVEADAECLPIADESFDRVTANHMPYHVRGQYRALLEMRRVLRPGGRVVLTTNGSAFMERFAAVHAQAASCATSQPKVSGPPSHLTILVSYGVFSD